LDNCTADILNIQNHTPEKFPPIRRYSEPAFELADRVEEAGNDAQKNESSDLASLAVHHEFNHQLQMQQNMVNDAHHTISHLQTTVEQLEEETRVLRLDAVRDDESYKAALIERDILKEQLVQLETDASQEQIRNRNAFKSLQYEFRLNRSEIDYTREVLIRSRSELEQNRDQYNELQEKLNMNLLKLGRFEKKYYELKEIEDHQIRALDSLGNKLLQMQEELPELQHTIQYYSHKNQQLRRENQSSKWRERVLEETCAAMVEQIRAAKTQLDQQEENTANLQREFNHQEEMLESLAMDMDSRVNLEIALKAEIESLRSIAVEKNFLVDYMQTELDLVDVRDAKEMKTLQDALDTTVRWREEVVHQKRSNEDMSRAIEAVKVSLRKKDSAIVEIGKQTTTVRDRVDDMGNTQIMDVMIQDLDRLIDLFWENHAALGEVRKSIESSQRKVSTEYQPESPFAEQSMDFEEELQRIELMQENSKIQRMVEKKYTREPKYNPLKWFK
jgi:chromosome segregation ATPase